MQKRLKVTMSTQYYEQPCTQFRKYEINTLRTFGPEGKTLINVNIILFEHRYTWETFTDTRC